MDFRRMCLLVVSLFNTDYVLTALPAPAPIGIGIACNATVTCVDNAECSTTNNTCVCSPAFKVDGTKCAAKGLGDSCTNKADCIAVNQSTCDTGKSPKCICITTHKAVSDQCEMKVIGRACNTSTAATVCSLQHSECSTKACACIAGYYNNNDKCLKVLGSSCDSSNATTVCTSPNSECSTTSKQCACKIGFMAEDIACPKALGQSCTQTSECVSNAVCDSSKNCTCKGGFHKADGFCAHSSAVEHRLALSIAGVSLLLVILNFF